MSDGTISTSAPGIAVVGMSGRFPGAKSIGEFWSNLRNGVESITFFSDEELQAAGVDPTWLAHPEYVKAAGIVDGLELFDAPFFGFSARDAEVLDPQHRMFLECSWEALEHAGYNPETYPGLIGVYGGVAMSTYLYQLYSHPERLAYVDPFQLMVSNDKDHLTTQVSYKLNLRGPSVTVQTACSTSLVAVAMACHNLLSYQCDMALAGGAAATVPQKRGYLYQRGGITSPDGHCRAFDARAQGTIAGSGAGVVVLKRLADALADHDHVHAVIKGAAINNDGALKVGYTAPSVDGQAQAIAMAQAWAGIDPETISYIEAHGTATPLGDPIEVAALTQVFRLHTKKTGFCAIGSVKTNIGHLDPAAGVAGLIKTVLSLTHEQLPPSLHYEQSNPAIDFASSPFYVNSRLSDWKRGETPRRAGVSSFGIGGTNAHVLVEEAPRIAQAEEARGRQLLVVSARSGAALEAATDNLARHLREHPQLRLGNVAYTCQVGRKTFRHRRMLLCHDDVADAVSALETRDPKRVLSATEEVRNRPIVFMFSGQGTQFVGMGRELYDAEPAFREPLDMCVEKLVPWLGLDLRTVLFPTTKKQKAAASRLNNTALAQPALFALEYALASVWKEWGVQPQAMIGHSIGEYVAACLAGVFSLDDALRLVTRRGELMGKMPPGAMLSVPLSEMAVQSHLGRELSLAAVNGSGLCVVSGTTQAIESLESALSATGIECRRLRTSHAFHSAMMDPILEEFSREVAGVALASPTIPYLSNVTGTWMTAEAAVDPQYWVAQLRGTVRFADGLNQVVRDAEVILLEIGPGQSLATLARQQSGRPPGQPILHSLPGAQQSDGDTEVLMNALGRLWLAGFPVAWSNLYTRGRPYRVPLPTYPFERQRYWIDPPETTTRAAAAPSYSGLKQDIRDWFYVPSWKRAASVELVGTDTPNLPSRWLVFSSGDRLAAHLVTRLEHAGCQVTQVLAGREYGCDASGVCTIDPANQSDYVKLCRALRDREALPDGVVHLWSMSATEGSVADDWALESAMNHGFYSLLFFTQALAAAGLAQPLSLGVISNRVHDVMDGEVISPAKAMVLGPCKVIPQEYPHITCRSIDIEAPATDDDADSVAAQLVTELTLEPFESVVAYRGTRRWVQTFDPVKFEASSNVPALLRQRGVYLITGGLGKIGLVIAEYLARTVQARLVLVGRSPLPERDQWEEWLAAHGGDLESARITAVRRLEALGAEVMVATADAADVEQMRRVVTDACDRFGGLHGVIHGAGHTAADSSSPIAHTDRAACERHFAPKVRGLRALQAALAGRDVEFYFLLSSLSSVLGGLGFVAYSAANVFMDAYAATRNREKGPRWVTANWDGWMFGSASDTGPGSVALSNLIQPDEGAEAFHRILTKAPKQPLVVSTLPLHERIDQWIKLSSLRTESSTEEREAGHRHERPNLATPFVAPRSRVEEVIAQLWDQLLGIEKVGVFDNFFELGGHSLLGIQLISRLQETFRVELSVHRLFEAPTVAELAESIDKETELAHGDDEKLAELLELVEGLSDHDVRQLLAQREQPTAE